MRLPSRVAAPITAILALTLAAGPVLAGAPRQDIISPRDLATGLAAADIISPRDPATGLAAADIISPRDPATGLAAQDGRPDCADWSDGDDICEATMARTPGGTPPDGHPAALHVGNSAHRDIKPKNVLGVSRRGWAVIGGIAVAIGVGLIIDNNRGGGADDGPARNPGGG